MDYGTRFTYIHHTTYIHHSRVPVDFTFTKCFPHIFIYDIALWFCFINYIYQVQWVGIIAELIEEKKFVLALGLC